MDKPTGHESWIPKSKVWGSVDLPLFQEAEFFQGTVDRVTGTQHYHINYNHLYHYINCNHLYHHINYNHLYHYINCNHLYHHINYNHLCHYINCNHLYHRINYNHLYHYINCNHLYHHINYNHLYHYINYNHLYHYINYNHLYHYINYTQPLFQEAEFFQGTVVRVTDTQHYHITGFMLERTIANMARVKEGTRAWGAREQTGEEDNVKTFTCLLVYQKEKGKEVTDNEGEEKKEGDKEKKDKEAENWTKPIDTWNADDIRAEEYKELCKSVTISWKELVLADREQLVGESSQPGSWKENQKVIC